MSGETMASESGWTVDTLKAYLESMIDVLQGQLDERYATQTKAVDAAFQSQQTAMQTAFTAADKAVDKALSAAEKAVDARAETLDREFHEHLEQVRHENALAFLNSDKAISAAFEASDRAIGKAETANEKRFDAVNEFRRTLADQTGTFTTRVESEGSIGRNNERIEDLSTRVASMVSRDEFGVSHSALQTRVTDLATRLDKSDGRGAGYASVYAWVVGAIGLMIAVVVGANAIFR